MYLARRVIATGAVVAACAGAVAFASATSGTTRHTTVDRAATVVDGAPGYAVEDF
ncbi:hypothetical protein GT346_42480, partial [Streptomyces sp. SID161]|nr:hypothetical protein [Streptomyces sp. SID161]